MLRLIRYGGILLAHCNTEDSEERQHLRYSATKYVGVEIIVPQSQTTGWIQPGGLEARREFPRAPSELGKELPEGRETTSITIDSQPLLFSFTLSLYTSFLRYFQCKLFHQLHHTPSSEITNTDRMNATSFMYFITVLPQILFIPCDSKTNPVLMAERLRSRVTFRNTFHRVKKWGRFGRETLLKVFPEFYN